MTHDNDDRDQDDRDRRLAALIRQASQRETDQAALARAVLGRLDQPAGRVPRLPSFAPQLAAASFALLLLAAGFTGYTLSGFGPEDGTLFLTLGDANLIGDPLVDLGLGALQ